MATKKVETTNKISSLPPFLLLVDHRYGIWDPATLTEGDVRYMLRFLSGRNPIYIVLFGSGQEDISDSKKGGKNKKFQRAGRFP
jgi:hypothetical protein